jgi:hypothetical protein
VWLWVALDPLSKLIPVLHLGARSQDTAHTVVHDQRQRLAPDCLPIFTSDGLNLYFYALTAHFGRWVQGVGRRAREWQVVAGLLYGHLKKRYRRRRLLGVTYIMRCSPREGLRAALQALGLSGKLNTAFVERLKKDPAAECRGADWSDVVKAAGGAAVVRASGVVARVVSFRAPTRVAPRAAEAADRTWWQASAPAVSAANTSDGGRADQPTLDRAGTSWGPAPAGPDWR